jgi:ASCH domain
VTELDKVTYALSVRQPWAWAIIRAGKDIENRNWPKGRFIPRGRIAIHASKTMTKSEYFDFMVFYARTQPFDRPILPCAEDFEKGGIIGTVDLVDVVTESKSTWFEGPIGLVLSNPRPLPFIPWNGMLGFWEAPNIAARE